jgi:hypothetical protein
VEVRFQAFLTTALDGGETDSCTTRRNRPFFCPQSTGSSMGTSRSEAGAKRGKKVPPYARNRTPIMQHVASHYTNSATPTHPLWRKWHPLWSKWVKIKNIKK